MTRNNIFSWNDWLACIFTAYKPIVGYLNSNDSSVCWRSFTEPNVLQFKFWQGPKRFNFDDQTGVLIVI